MHRTSTRLGLFLGCVLLAACGGSSGNSAPSPPPAPITTIDEPTTVDLYPNESSVNPARLTVMVTAVGFVPVSMPIGFDTGSAGITLYAPSIFPASMLGADGFIFPSGETQMSYQGVTVTNQQGTRTYGSVLETRSENGNLGFATVTFWRCKRRGQDPSDARVFLLLDHRQSDGGGGPAAGPARLVWRRGYLRVDPRSEFGRTGRWISGVLDHQRRDLLRGQRAQVPRLCRGRACRVLVGTGHDSGL
jgi:hypothetical protein